MLNRLDSTEGFGLWLRPAGARNTGRAFVFYLFFHLARFSRFHFIPPRHDSGAGLFTCAGFGFARSGFSTETAKSLRGTIYFLIHGFNIHNRLRIIKRKMELFLPQKRLALRCWRR
jgi:hypothetical protein